MIRWLMSGGQMFQTTGANPVGGFTGGGFSIASPGTPPAGAPGDGYAFELGGGSSQTLKTPVLGAGNYSGLISGCRMNLPVLANNQQLLGFYDALGNLQCDVRTNVSGQLIFTKNGTAITGYSSFALSTLSWFYIEFKSLFSASAGGTCECRINSSVVLTATGLTNAQNTNGGAVASFSGSQQNVFMRDFYALDTSTSGNINYLGDIDVVELYGNGPGVNSAWTTNIGPLTGTAVANASGGSTVYTYSTWGLATSALVGYNFVTSSYAHGANNGTFPCTASTATTVTLTNPSGVSDTTGSLAFQCPVQIGINKSGTRPNGDTVYMLSSTTNNITDFAHTSLTLTGSVLGVCQWSYLRKDDAGARSVAQVVFSGSASEQGTTINLGNSYSYYANILETDPNTGVAFTVAGVNNFTAGLKELT
jgi:hypothetical protein